MRKRIVKISILLCITLCLLAVLPTFAYVVQEDINWLRDGADQPVLSTINIDGYTMKVDQNTLNMSITDGEYTWHSGLRNDDDGLNNVWANKIIDAVTVGYRSTTTGNQTERGFTDLNSTVSFTVKDNGFSARIRLNTIGISFRLEVSLSNGVLNVSIPSGSIAENKTDKYKLMYMSIYPFFNSSHGATNGYIFVPDGSGALIDLSLPTSAKQPYCARVYGEDLGITSTSPTATSPYTVQMPVYSTLYNNGGAFTIITSGAEYAEINAYVSGITTNYNYAYSRFIYRQEYTKYLQSSGSEGKSYVACQDNLNVFDASLRIHLLKGNKSTHDIATIYRDYLVGKGYLTNNADNLAVQLRLQFLMAENKQSMFGSTTLAMTTTDYVRDVIEQLDDVNLSISLLGYTVGGLTGSYPNVLPFASVTGSKRDYKQLIEFAEQKNVPLSFACNFTTAYQDANSVSKKDKALNISEQFISINDINNRALTTSQTFSALTYQATFDNYSKAKQEFLQLGGKYLDLYATGRYLYSSYYNQVFTRSQLIENYRTMLMQEDMKYNIDSPNDYLWPYSNSYLSTPCSSSGFIIESTSVPFLQMVITGYLPMYSKAINLDYMGVQDVLKLIEYNVYPEFILTQEDAIELYGTQSQYIFTSQYEIWQEQALNIYNTVNDLLSQVSRSQYISHTALANGVYLCGYSNGKSIIVNYNNTDYNHNGQIITAQSAAVVE